MYREYKPLTGFDFILANHWLTNQYKIDRLWWVHTQEQLPPRDQDAGFVALNIKYLSDKKFKYTRSTSFIYFIESPRTRRVKIGYSSNLKRRITDLKLSAPDRLKMRAIIKGDKEIESLIHNAFYYSRANGEWFVKSKRLEHFIEYIKDGMHRVHVDLVNKLNGKL